MATFERPSAKMATEFENAMNEDVRAQKKNALEKLNTQENIKKDSNRYFAQNSLKNFELYKRNIRSKHLREWSSLSILYYQKSTIANVIRHP